VADGLGVTVGGGETVVADLADLAREGEGGMEVVEGLEEV